MGIWNLENSFPYAVCIKNAMHILTFKHKNKSKKKLLFLFSEVNISIPGYLELD